MFATVDGERLANTMETVGMKRETAKARVASTHLVIELWRGDGANAVHLIELPSGERLAFSYLDRGGRKSVRTEV